MQKFCLTFCLLPDILNLDLNINCNQFFSFLLCLFLVFRNRGVISRRDRAHSGWYGRRQRSYFQTDLFICQLIVDSTNLSKVLFRFSVCTKICEISPPPFLFIFFPSVTVIKVVSGILDFSLISARRFEHFTIKYDECSNYL